MQKAKTVKQAESFCKSQLLEAKRYKEYKDIITVVLSDGYLYTHEEAEKAIKDFLNKEVI